MCLPLTLGEIFFLEELDADCAADGRHAFLCGGGNAHQSLPAEVAEEITDDD